MTAGSSFWSAVRQIRDQHDENLKCKATCPSSGRGSPCEVAKEWSQFFGELDELDRREREQAEQNA